MQQAQQRVVDYTGLERQLARRLSVCSLLYFVF